MTVPRPTVKRQQVGPWPNSWNPLPLPKRAEYPSHPLAYEITQPYETYASLIAQVVKNPPAMQETLV